MTEMEIRQKVVKTAEAYLGCKESDGSHRKIIDIYNSQKHLPVGYKVTYSDAWCSAFVSAISIICGLTDIIPTECGCGRHIDLFRKLGIWVESDGYIPTVGDIILYSWNDNGVGECTTGASHIGYVVSCDGKNIRVIEGNISNSVGYRTLAVNGRYIRGFATPNYASKAEPDTKNLVAEIMELVEKMVADKQLKDLTKQIEAITKKILNEKYNLDVKKIKSIVEDYLKQRDKNLKDNDSSDWSKEAREWAVKNGIVIGVGEKNGEPNYAWQSPLTREQMAVMLHRFANLLNCPYLKDNGGG